MKIVIWGHKLYTHTHSFIHYGFFKAFNSMGYDTYWFDDNDDVSKFNFKDCLFLTEGQVCIKMPQRSDCKYILHHVKNFDKNLKNVNIKVYNSYNIDTMCSYEKINDYTFYDKTNNCLIQPWATDLLPDEINFNDTNFPRENSIYYIGSVSKSGWNSAYNECIEFAKAASTKNIKFIVKGGYTGNSSSEIVKFESGMVTTEDSIGLIKKSYFAPVFQSVEQRDIKYIPCRIFKNISYGQYPITNCKHLCFLFDDKLIYNDNTYDLFFDAESKKNNDVLKELMQIVKTKHTFINRINQIMEIL